MINVGHLVEPFKNFLEDIFSKTNSSNKMLHIAGNFNLKFLDYNNCKKVQDFVNLIYQNSMVLVINKLTRVTRKIATIIDPIIINCFLNSKF